MTHRYCAPPGLAELLKQRQFHFGEVSGTAAIHVADGPVVVFASPDLGYEIEARSPKIALSVVCVRDSFKMERDIVLAASGRLVVPSDLKPATLCEVVERLMKRSDPAGWLASRYRLSCQEARLLRCMMRGLNAHESAEHMGCKVQTLPTYWTRIFKKTGVTTQRELLLLLIRRLEAWRPTHSSLSQGLCQGAS